MDRRIANLNISSAGGTAAKGSKTCKVTIPTTLVEAMGVTADQRELDMVFDGTRITLSRRLNGLEFVERQQAHGYEARILRLYDGDVLCSTIYADFAGQTVVVENQMVSPIKTAFGNNSHPTWEDFKCFLAEHCIPRQRAGLWEYLEALGVDEYNPLASSRRPVGAWRRINNG